MVLYVYTPYQKNERRQTMKSCKIDSSFFDVEHNRNNTGSVKYDRIPVGTHYSDIIPMWIADMDFKVPPQVEDALTQTSRHGIFGYTDIDSEYDLAVVNWYSQRMNWDILPEWIIKTPGVMFAIAAAINAFTDTNDSILICQPVYYPFSNIITENKRNLVVSQLRVSGERYEIDFEDFEEKIKENNIKMFLLCSPHNPVGRVWTKDELCEIGRICRKYNVLIVSDEIHSDFIYKGYRHIPIISLSDELAENTITCTSPSKTFNLAGLQAANIIVKNPFLRKKLQQACNATGYSNLNTMAINAVKAAYKYGQPWLDTLLEYLESNISFLKKSLDDCDISLISPEGTYLMWIDCRKLHLSDRELRGFFINEAGIYLHSGSTFGKGGTGFMRMNIACPKATLSKAVSRLKEALIKI